MKGADAMSSPEAARRHSSNASLDVPGSLPAVVQSAAAGARLEDWLPSNLTAVREYLTASGGVLLRGFGVATVEEFEQIMRLVAGDLLDYSYRSSPRTLLSGKIYTSTEYPADQSIPFHNEHSYDSNWPMKIGFCCLTAPTAGGETPIADSRRVFERIDPAIRTRFAGKQVMYVRNYREGLDLSWQNVFQTSDKSGVEAYCRAAGIDVEWKAGGGLRTRQVCQAVATHPITGETVWFNQAHLFHVSNLPDAVREQMLEIFGEDELPRNTYYGDGTAIDDDVLREIRDAYRQESVVFPWRQGDVLILDNMLVAHARNPFAGPRKIVVAMGEPAR
jgi:alpha-ketoglutarate-dependent taurine dioxygenase